MSKTLFYNAKVYVERDTFAQAVYQEDGWIKAVGSNEDVCPLAAEDAEKIKKFAFPPETDDGECWDPDKINSLLVVGNIPEGDDADAITDAVFDTAFDSAPFGVAMFNFETVDGDYFGAMPGVGLDGKFQLFGADSSYVCDMNPFATERAYRKARQARFEYGETPRVRRRWR